MTFAGAPRTVVLDRHDGPLRVLVVGGSLGARALNTVVPQALALIDTVGADNLFLQYDIYHMQIMEGDVIRTLKDNAAYIGHYHTAGNPGRAEFEAQDQQELNYAPIMRAIKSTGYKGFVGQEFIPKRDPLTSLREAVKLCNV